MAKTSARSRSYLSAQTCVSLRASINWALTRTRFAERCTLPSRTCATFSACAISGRLRVDVFLYCITMVRLITFRSAIFAKSVRISSWTPSAKNANALSWLKFSNGKTAIDFAGKSADALCLGAAVKRPSKNKPIEMAPAITTT